MALGAKTGVEAIPATFMVGALLAASYGAFTWLKYGQWASVSIFDSLVWLGASPNFLGNSFGWVGIGEVSTWIGGLNIGWALLISAALSRFFVDIWADEFSKKPR